MDELCYKTSNGAKEEIGVQRKKLIEVMSHIVKR
jgi:hypothetical protein